MKAQQIPLQIKFNKGHRFANYYAGDNAAVLARLKTLVTIDHSGDESDGQISFLFGLPGSGKSHLAEALCNENDANAGAICVSIAQLCEFIEHAEALPADLFDAFLPNRLICLDDFEAVGGLQGERKQFLEEQLFGLINQQILNRQFSLLICSSVRLASLPIDLPDLRSRLALATILELADYNDQRLEQILCFKAKSIGLEMPSEVAQYLIKRLPRGMHALSETIESLDKYSLASSRRLTIPMVKEALQL